jgi:flagellin
LAEGDLVVNNVSVGATDASMDAASTTLQSSSAIAKVKAINEVSAKSGVKAEALATRVTSTAVTAAAASISINGAATLAIAQQANVGLQVQAIVDAVNGIAGQTGVTAEILDGDQYQLVAADGRNIQINIGGAGGGVTTGVTAGGVALQGAGTIDVSSNTGNIENSGFDVGKYGGAAAGQLLKDVDISTVDGANKALKAIDNALATVSRNAAGLGAIQSRFESTISNLSSTSENLSAANSRTKDADFAAETAALSRSQVLQQAGISVLAQANARPQQVLSLLQ